MGLCTLTHRLLARLRRRPPDLKSFDEALRRAGSLICRADAGLRTVAVDQIVGSVGRARCLRADFFPRTGPAMTARHRRIGEALLAGTPLPPLELYALTGSRSDHSAAGERREFYVVDGHHRVAMARRLGQLYLEAHVVEYRVAMSAPATGEHHHPPAPAGGRAPAGAATSPAGAVMAGPPAGPPIPARPAAGGR
jgi:hypothetical protein